MSASVNTSASVGSSVSGTERELGRFVGACNNQLNSKLQIL